MKWYRGKLWSVVIILLCGGVVVLLLFLRPSNVSAAKVMLSKDEDEPQEQSLMNQMNSNESLSENWKQNYTSVANEKEDKEEKSMLILSVISLAVIGIKIALESKTQWHK